MGKIKSVIELKDLIITEKEEDILEGFDSENLSLKIEEATAIFNKDKELNYCNYSGCKLAI
ncbi:hypothetical protein MM239_18475 [Belliella sp. DSM 111904]|uniref:Uncharacterized protein n=1 Tax=Belliella filtrata TaxID=2923435 RepID=A0ABS9V618_9BACT|nr:hypothetical protein [Belliella filtrata]MCH7411385.1 hypothetical protein [Belliella filtrata]